MSWERALGDLEQALDAFDGAGLDDVEQIAATLPEAVPAVAGPIPTALQDKAFRLQARLVAVIADMEARRAEVGSELAAIGAATTAGGDHRPTPKYLDTRA